MVSVDIEEGATVTFDSYPYTGNECQICKLAKPSRNLASKNLISKNNDNVSNDESYKRKNRSELIEHIDKSHRQRYRYRNINKGSSIHWSVYDGDGNYLFYDGIEAEHVIASASFQETVFDFPASVTVNRYFNNTVPDGPKPGELVLTRSMMRNYSIA